MVSESDASSQCPICEGPTTSHLQGLYDDRYGYPGRFDSRRCRRCGHVFLDASFTDEDLGQLYSRWYPRAEVQYEELPPLAPTRGLRAWLNGETHAAHAWCPPDVSVLDIGCGFGRTLAFHTARGCRAVGVEADEHAVAEARRHGLQVIHGLFDPRDHEPASYDVVTMDQVLEHARQPIEFMTGVATVLKPGGIAIVSTPNAGGYGARVFGPRWINWHTPYHLNVFTKRSLRRLAGRTGLTLASTRTTTATAWLRYQWLTRYTRPEPGNPSPFWDPRRASGRVPPRARRWARRFDRVLAFAFASRVTDGLGIGDNIVAVLTKPASP
jgi:2-polyprenyl-3-methyl-5-hydroxy-6-metoxy-1,4-benzoquinol methylase